jgi:hypothetical protein
MWAGLGFFSERANGRFVIHKVTGPDGDCSGPRLRVVIG